PAAKRLGKPDTGNPSVRFDEGSESDGHWRKPLTPSSPAYSTHGVWTPRPNNLARLLNNNSVSSTAPSEGGPILQPPRREVEQEFREASPEPVPKRPRRRPKSSVRSAMSIAPDLRPKEGQFFNYGVPSRAVG